MLDRKFLGKGRSGVVFLETNSLGELSATKIFSGEDTLATVANYIFYGAPNAYAWCEDAVRCAHFRRKILEKLITFWFSDKLRIASSYGTGWNDEMKAFEIKTEFINGRHACLHHPFSIEQEWELKDLVDNITVPLQKRLEESGFDGLVWQAGKGNPTAISNFMLSDGKWVWIDAESGVPALFPLNPIALLTFYIPKTFRYMAPMFDDVDIKKLKSYFVVHDINLQEYFGFSVYQNILNDIDLLEKHQSAWKGMSRVRRSVTSQLKVEKISQQQADFFLRHPYLWYPRELWRISLVTFLFLFYFLPAKALNKLINFPFRILFANVTGFIFNTEKRKNIIRNYIQERIEKWVKRKHLSGHHAGLLRDQLANETTSPYLTDLMVVVGLKPLMNVVEIVGLPTLFAIGAINELVLGIGLAFGGSIYRTAYTLIRMLLEIRKSPSVRLSRNIALFTGMVPTVGNGSYAIQMVFSATQGSKELAEFIIYDMSSVIGGKIPVWGGKDTRTEHFFNHFPDVIVKNRMERSET